MELATIARPYANALFRVVSGGDLTAWSDWLQKLAQIAGHPDMRFLASHPKIKREQLGEFLLSAILIPNAQNTPDTPDTPDSKLAKNFVLMLVNHRRLNTVPEIAKQFDRLKNAHENVADATIISAFPLDEQELTELMTKLKRWFGQTLKPQVSVDPSLIGGVRVTVADEIFDTSVRMQLARIQTALTTCL